jgi:hypothetical protein
VNNPAPELIAFLLAGLIVVCATILIATGHPVPDSLWLLGSTVTTLSNQPADTPMGGPTV